MALRVAPVGFATESGGLVLAMVRFLLQSRISTFRANIGLPWGKARPSHTGQMWLVNAT